MRWYQLKLGGIKNSKIRKLMMRYRYPKEILEKKEVEFLNSIEVEYDRLEEILLREKNIEFFSKLERLKIGLIDMNDCRYPERLKNIEIPPLFLFYSGDISLLRDEKIIAIVGTRSATKYGEMCTEKVVKELLDGDVVVVSGLACGIDSIAHRKVLELGGKTIAVLPCGIDKVYPDNNYELKDKIIKSGLVISEFPVGTMAMGRNFPIRNRIIAGLSKGVAVIESAKKGGALITANIAFEENRDLFVVPGDLSSKYSEGCNNLIKEMKGKLITGGKDILDEYNWISKGEEIIEQYKLEGKKLLVYTALDSKKHIEILEKELKIEISELLTLLMELELEGVIQSLAGGYYIKKI